MASYEMTVKKLRDICNQMIDAGASEELVVIANENGGAPMPIVGILHAGVGNRERWGSYIMSEEECKTAPDDTPQVIVLQMAMMSPVGWLSRELSTK